MCEKCYRRGKNSKVRKGLINYFAHQALAGYPIPMFGDGFTDHAIEGRVWEIQRNRTKKSKYGQDSERL